MKETLMNFLNVQTLNELREKQPNKHAFKAEGQVSDDVALTIAGIKILNQYFEKNRKLWNLVEKKARKYVLGQTGMTKDALDGAIEGLDADYQEFDLNQ